MKNEIWRDIKGYEGSYQVSNLGRIKSLDRYIWCKSNKSYSLFKGKIHKLDTKDKKYAQIGIWLNSECSKYLIHRLVAIAFIPNPNDYPEVNHKDADKLNNNAENLEWCTHLQNQRDAKLKGLYADMPKGINRYNAKLNDSAVRHIRQKVLKNGEYVKLYGIAKSTISMIQSCPERWRHII